MSFTGQLGSVASTLSNIELAFAGSFTTTLGIATVTITGQAPTAPAVGNATATPGVGTVQVSGVAPTVSPSGAAPVTAGVGTVTVSGIAPEGGLSASPAVATVTVSGIAPSAVNGVNLQVATVSLQGASPTALGSGVGAATAGVGTVNPIVFAPTWVQTYVFRNGDYDPRRPDETDTPRLRPDEAE